MCIFPLFYIMYLNIYLCNNLHLSERFSKLYSCTVFDVKTNKFSFCICIVFNKKGNPMEKVCTWKCFSTYIVRSLRRRILCKAYEVGFCAKHHTCWGIQLQLHFKRDRITAKVEQVYTTLTKRPHGENVLKCRPKTKQ